MGEEKSKFADIRSRILVLVLLTVFVFIPIVLWPQACTTVFYAAIALAVAEWIRGIAQSAAGRAILKGDILQAWRVLFSLSALALWAIPTAGSVKSRIEGECPGHRKSMEAIAIVLLVSDSAQLLCGRLFGRTKFAPSISPKKTVEGYLGGLAITILYGYIIHGWLLSTLVAVYIGGCFGDLYFSVAKRAMGLKDFSSLLGPHGGVCDRIDSFVFAWLVLDWAEC